MEAKHLVAGALAFLLVMAATVGSLRWAGAGQDGDLDAAALDGPDLLGGLPAPAWRVGDKWHLNFEPSGFSCDLIVASAEAEGYLQGAACEDASHLVAQDAVFDFAFLGRFGPGLEGVTAGGPVAFYSWPLVDGKEWDATWHDRTFRVRATFDPALEGPEGEPEAGFLLEMTRGGEPYASYDYLPSLRWWSFLELEGGFRVEVESFEEGWTGEAVTAVAMGTGPTVVSVSGSAVLSLVAVGDEGDLVAFQYAVQGPGLHRIQVRTPSGNIVYEDTSTHLDFSTRSELVFLPFEAGTWRVESPHAGLGGVRLSLHAIDVRTLAVGEA